MSGGIDACPDTYAKHLASYIRDPSTVRARTFEQFGDAPPVERIRRYRADHDRLRARLHNCYLEPKYDGTRYDAREKFVREERAKVVVELPKIEHVEPKPKPASIRDCVGSAEIISFIAQEFGLTREIVTSPSRRKEFAMVRSLIAMVLTERGCSTPQVGRWLNRDHSSIVYARQMFPKYVAKNPALDEARLRLLAELRGEAA